MTKLHYKTLFFFLSVILISKGGFSQIYNCNGFLQGKYLQAGINWNGCFGTSSKPPAGFHADTLSRLYTDPVSCGDTIRDDTSLAFVADPAMDGWSTGTPPYFGDYVLPGGPNEGWGVQIFGIDYDVWNNNNQFTDTLPMGTTSSISNYSHDVATHSQIVTAAAITSNGALQVTEFVTLDTLNLYLTVEVEFDYSGTSTTDNIYYIRAINPHNDMIEGGSMATKQKIVYQNPDTLDRVLVTAIGTHYSNASIAMGSTDSATLPMAFISKSLQMPTSGSLDSIYNGLDTNYLYNAGDSITGNVGMGLVFNVGSMSPGGTAYLTFYYSFSANALDSILGDTSLSVSKIVTSPVNLFAYPNPFQNQFKINGLQKTDDIQFFDMMGRQVNTAIKRNGFNNFEVANLLPGMYFILVKDAFGEVKANIQIQKL